jgi:hypothetical protein
MNWVFQNLSNHSNEINDKVMRLAGKLKVSGRAANRSG